MAAFSRLRQRDRLPLLFASSVQMADGDIYGTMSLRGMHNVCKSKCSYAVYRNALKSAAMQRLQGALKALQGNECKKEMHRKSQREKSATVCRCWALCFPCRRHPDQTSRQASQVRAGRDAAQAARGEKLARRQESVRVQGEKGPEKDYSTSKGTPMRRSAVGR